MQKLIEYHLVKAVVNKDISLYTISSHFAKTKEDINNEEEAFNYLATMAQEKDKELIYMIGMMYISGTYVKINIPKAKRFLTRAVKLNSVYAMYNLALLILNEEDKDINKVVELLIDASKKGNMYSKEELGKIYYDGIFLKQDYKLASEYFLEAKTSKSYEYLSIMYKNGTYFKQDEQLSKSYSEKAIEVNKAENDYYEGIVSYYNDNLEDAYHKFLSAANINSSAQNAIGMMYYNGEYVEKDYKKAYEYILSSGLQEDYKGLYNLGIMHYNGIGTNVSFKDAYNCFSKSLYCGNDNAYSKIGVMYYNGEYVDLDYKKSLLYFLGIEKDKESLYYLGLMYLNAKFVSLDYKKARYYFNEAIKYGYIITDEKINKIL